MRLLKPRFRSHSALAAVTLIAAALWFVGPVLDEILGARMFKRLCEEMQPIVFYGPVAVGPGGFFDESGNRRWRTVEEFSAIKRSTKEWERLFDVRQQKTSLTRWPVPIFELTTTDFEKSSGGPTVVSRFRGSEGGWIKQVTGWGRLAPYQCPSKGKFRDDETRIVFARDALENRDEKMSK
jgi:hypothetical protein